MRASDGGILARVVDGSAGLLMRRRLDRVLVHADASLEALRGAVLYAANHVSWWDGFLVRRAHAQLRGGPLFSIMLDTELRSRPILRRAGALGIEPGSLTSVRRLLRFVADQARRREVSVAIYPQGRIYPSGRRPLGFQGGVGLVARAMGAPWVVPVGLHVEPLNRPTPTAFVLAGRPVRWRGSRDVPQLERQVEGLLDRIHAHLHQFGESSADAWTDAPPSPTTLETPPPNLERAP